MTLAKYIKRSLCTCGYGVLHDDVPLGRIYSVDLETVKPGTLGCGSCHALIPVTMVFAEASETGTAGWLPLDLFEVEADT